jgi:hypothetical protein
MPTIFQLINKREYAENAMLARQEVKIEDIRNVARKKIAKGASLAYAILIESKEVARNSYNELRLVLCCVNSFLHAIIYRQRKDKLLHLICTLVGAATDYLEDPLRKLKVKLLIKIVKHLYRITLI